MFFHAVDVSGSFLDSGLVYCHLRIRESGIAFCFEEIRNCLFFANLNIPCDSIIERVEERGDRYEKGR